MEPKEEKNEEKKEEEKEPKKAKQGADVSGSIEILERKQIIGEGTFAIVELCKTTKNKFIATKKLKLDHKSSKKKIENAKKEIELCSKIDSSFIVKMLSYYDNKADKTSARKIEMYFQLCGYNLHVFQQLQPQKQLPPKLLVYVLFCMLKALDYLHRELRISHRDVKPENILLGSNGKCQLTDQGSSKYATKILKSYVGTTRYMAQEVYNSQHGGGAYKLNVDIWSLGITILELSKIGFDNKVVRFDNEVDKTDMYAGLYDMCAGGGGMKWKKAFKAYDSSETAYIWRFVKDALKVSRPNPAKFIKNIYKGYESGSDYREAHNHIKTVASKTIEYLIKYPTSPLSAYTYCKCGYILEGSTTADLIQSNELYTDGVLYCDGTHDTAEFSITTTVWHCNNEYGHEDGFDLCSLCFKDRKSELKNVRW